MPNVPRRKSSLMAKPQIDLFLILRHLDSRDFTVHEQLSGDPEVLKEFETQIGWLIPQWMLGGVTEAGSRKMISEFNAKANQVWGALSKHPELRAKLLASCGLGQPMKHKFIRPKGIKKKDPLFDMVLELYPDARVDEVALFLKDTGREEILELCKSLGYQKDEVAQIEKQLP